MPRIFLSFSRSSTIAVATSTFYNRVSSLTGYAAANPAKGFSPWKLQIPENTIFITGEASRISACGLFSQALCHTLGNQIIISGGSAEALDIVTAANSEA